MRLTARVALANKLATLGLFLFLFPTDLGPCLGDTALKIRWIRKNVCWKVCVLYKLVTFGDTVPNNESRGLPSLCPLQHACLVWFLDHLNSHFPKHTYEPIVRLFSQYASLFYTKQVRVDLTPVTPRVPDPGICIRRTSGSRLPVTKEWTHQDRWIMPKEHQ